MWMRLQCWYIISGIKNDTDPEDDTGGDNLSIEAQGPSPDFPTNSQGFLSISTGWEEDGDSKEGSTSSSTLWSRVDELPDELKDKMISLKNEGYL